MTQQCSTPDCQGTLQGTAGALRGRKGLARAREGFPRKVKVSRGPKEEEPRQKWEEHCRQRKLLVQRSCGWR